MVSDQRIVWPPVHNAFGMVVAGYQARHQSALQWPAGGASEGRNEGIMDNSAGPRGLMLGRVWPLLLVALATALLVFIACFMVWYHFGGGAWRTNARVVEVKLAAPDTLILTVTSCRGGPSVAMSRETDTDVLVGVLAFYTPLHGGLDCLEYVNVYLEEPLGDRVVVDTHSGEIFGGPSSTVCTGLARSRNRTGKQ